MPLMSSNNCFSFQTIKNEKKKNKEKIEADNYVTLDNKKGMNDEK